MNLPYKLCATDLDETLLQADHTISPRTHQTLCAVKALGVKIVLVTGRMHEAAEKYASQLGLETPMVSYNGAMVKDIKTGEVWLQDSVPADLAEQIVDYCDANHLQLNYYLDGFVCTAEMTSWMKLYQERTGCPVKIVPDFARTLRGTTPVKLLIVDTPEKTTAIEAKFREIYKDRLYIVKSMAEYVEFIPPTVNKGRALELVGKRLEITKEEMIAFGDNENDIPLLQAAGLGVAVANARPATLAVAGRVAPRYDEDGVAQTLEEIFELKF